MQDVTLNVPEVFTPGHLSAFPAEASLSFPQTTKWNPDPAWLVEEALKNNEGHLTSTGALMCSTGKFTGRSPKDRFIVKDTETADTVWWGDINIPISEEHFDCIYSKMQEFLQDKQLYVRDAYAGADEKYRLRLRIVNTLAWQSLFCYNMFLRPTKDQLNGFSPDFTIICIPEFLANPVTDGTRSENFAIINVRKRVILIGGTAYAGEIKKGVFSALNFFLPTQHQVLPMHCSANIGEKGDTAILFGLSGTGKTTLSADPHRYLIGDDEHGWTDDSVFNFEGGCYAKAINLSKEQEPEIWDAIKFGSLIENTVFRDGSREVDYTNTSLTENTRVAYPIEHIKQATVPSVGGIPKNIFFLTADAFGVLPPISQLSRAQAMYHFMSGYTAKVAGTEEGIKEPQTVFSACFGAPFMPLHPAKYAKMLGEKIDSHQVKIWLVNTGWTGGPYGVGQRIKLAYTRAMIKAALEGSLNDVAFKAHSVFGTLIPQECPGVPAEVLSPRQTWNNDEAYYKKANELARAFIRNFEKYGALAGEEILKGAPKPTDNLV